MSFLQMVSPHLVAVALCSARLLPVSFLCPLLGGQVVPSHLRLGLVLSLAWCLHFEGGVAPQTQLTSVWEFAWLALRETLLGTAMGLIAALPFDAARMGGRFIDLFRGTSAEASLPFAGVRESATGDGLYQLLVALAVTGLAFPLVLGSLWKSFELVRLGAVVLTESHALYVVGLAGTALGTGLAVGAPIAAAVLGLDCLLGLASRVAPQMNLSEVSAPLRILGGGALLWLGVGLLSDRLLAGVMDLDGAFAGFWRLAP